MTERPILYQGAMVRAILADLKLQTRRLVKASAPSEATSAGVFFAPGKSYDAEWNWLSGDPRDCDSWCSIGDAFRCPYGQPGDRLWVRENGWQRPERTPRMMREGADTWEPYYFDADGLSEQESADFKAWGFKRRPSIHMPRWASRITLEITDVRVERLQDISEADAMAEGIAYSERFRGYCIGEAEHFNSHDPRESYRHLWGAINGPRSWDVNPWVWVVEFKRVKP